MKILTVRFSNLNSLYGEWLIDFTHEQFLNDGIFAITGPTGAGKSTILDAICLALYGRTPRLESIGLQSNEIMSRQRAACFAEVTFETKHGTFRCFWEQHRAHQRLDGNLVDAHHEISDVNSGKVLTTKKREVAQAVEKYTSMNFDRFTRSMLLAQGEFAAFLKADANQRSPILEQITGTEIYSQISRRVSEKYGEQRNLLEQYEEESALIQPLTQEQRQQKKAQEELYLLWAEGAKRRSRAFSETLINYRAIESQRELLQTLQTDQLKLTREGEELRPHQKRLTLAQRAMEIEASYTDWISKKETSETDKNERKQKHEELLHKQKQFIISETAAESDRLYYEKKRQELRTKRSVFTSARTLDQSIVHTQKYGDGIRSRLQQARRERRENITERSTLVARMDSLQAAMVALRTWLQECAVDATLSEDLLSIREAHVGLLEAQRNYTREKSAVEDAEKHLFDLEQQILQAKNQQTEIEKEVTTLDVEIKRIQEKIDALLGGVTKRGYQSELEHLLDKELLLATIASLETHRAALEDGKACPLCGALEHPYAKGTLPQASAVKQRIAEVRTILERLEVCTEDQDRIRDSQRKGKSNLVEKKTWLVSLQGQLEQGQKGLIKAKGLLTQSDENQSNAQSTVVKLLEKYFQSPIHIEDSVELLQELGERERQWLKNQQELETSKNEVKTLEAEISRLEKSIEHQTHSIFTLHADLVENRSSVEKSYRQRLSLLEEADVDEAERVLEAAVMAAEEKEKQAAKRVAEEAQQVEVLLSTVKALDKRITHNEKLQKVAEELFQSGLKAQAFGDEEEFLAVRMNLDRRTEIERTLKDFEERTTRITERLEAAKDHLEELLALHQEGWTEVQLQAEIDLFEFQSLHYNQRIGALREQLEADNYRRERYKTQQAKIKRQREICNLWNRLNTLIGSHDGKKFRNFAQGLTFELLLAHANEHLKALSDRYLLAPDPVQPLDVAVLDLYQAGELRSARNLSGGESFLVSLALSLGLSTIASKNVQVDSLFLDEGFGTLDEETLEMALSALVTLHNQGKLVGIISHVGALQERIPTQISVTPIAGGMSQIVGPGCSQLA